MGIFSGESARFRSPLSPEECVARLRRRIESRWSISAGTGFTGSVVSDRLAIGRKFTMAHNAYQSWFVGRIIAAAGGSEITGAFRIARSTAIGFCFMLGWFGLIGGAGTIVGTGQAWGHLLFAGFTALLLGFVAGFYRIGRWLARNDRRIISAMLVEVLVAEELN